MEKITAILDRKKTLFNKISPASSVNDALCRMTSRHMECLIVIDEEENFLGLLTEHEIATQTLCANQSLAKTRVREIMNSRLPFADISDTVEHCMGLMKQFHTRYIPVFEDRDFRGIISSDDILQEIFMSVQNAPMGKRELA